MACGGNFYNVQFCIHNNIYEELLSADMFEDLRVHGLQSTIAQNVKEKEAIRVSIGKFKHPVQILNIVPKDRIEQEMDVEV